MTDWLDDPAGTIFSLRRDAFDGTLEQWAVIPTPLESPFFMQVSRSCAGATGSLWTAGSAT